MTLLILPEQRTAEIASPETFAAFEETPLSVKPVAGATAATLRVALMSTTGALLALCDAFTAVTQGVGEEAETLWTGTLDCRTTAVSALFDADNEPDHRVPVVLLVYDSSRLWASQRVEMVAHPLAAGPLAPDPEETYLTRAMLSGVSLPSSATFDDIEDVLRAMLAALKGES